eukprot:COSAG05_NODE_11656_length_503_cov_0.990099_1_plen_28_part_10
MAGLFAATDAAVRSRAMQVDGRRLQVQL